MKPAILWAISAAALLATPAFGQTMNPCSGDWPAQAATREQVRAALGVIPCGLENTRPLQTTGERLAAKELELKEKELDMRIRAAEVGSRSNNWKHDITIWNVRP